MSAEPAHSESQRRPRHRPSRRGEVVDAAIRVFSEQGPDASVSDIAAEAGMAPAAIYYHFDSKGQLLEAALEKVSQQVTALTREDDGTPLPIFEVVHNVWHWMADSEGEARLLYLWMVPAGDDEGMVRRKFVERHVAQAGQRFARRGGKQLSTLERLASRTAIMLTLRASVATFTDERIATVDRERIIARLSDVVTRVLAAPHTSEKG